MYRDSPPTRGGEEDPRLNGAFTAVTEDLVEAIGAVSEERLVAGYRGLRRLYLELKSRIDPEQLDQVEADPAFNMGRLAGLLALAQDAIRRTTIEPIDVLVARVRAAPLGIEILQYLKDREGTLVRSAELAKELKRDAPSISTKLDELSDQGLIESRRLGHARLSRITKLGARVIEMHLSTKTPDARPSTNITKPVHEFSQLKSKVRNVP